MGRLIDQAADHDGFRSLSDQLWLDLVSRDRAGFAAVLGVDEDGRIGGYAQLAEGQPGDDRRAGHVPRRSRQRRPCCRRSCCAAFEVIAAGGGGTVYWWVHRPDDSADAIANRVGLTLGRSLLQMRPSLPIGRDHRIETRPFVVGRDETEWLRVNNPAFPDHPEQGGWTIETLRRREAEPWFDPEGFRLHERSGKLAAFCWTKVQRRRRSADGRDLRDRRRSCVSRSRPRSAP